MHASRIELDGESGSVINRPLDLAALEVAVGSVITRVEGASKVMFDLAGVPGQALLSDVFRNVEVLIEGSSELLGEIEWPSEVVDLARIEIPVRNVGQDCALVIVDEQVDVNRAEERHLRC